MFEHPISILFFALGGSLMLASPFIGIGLMVRLIRSSSNPGRNNDQRFARLESEIAAIKAEIQTVRETATQHVFS